MSFPTIHRLFRARNSPIIHNFPRSSTPLRIIIAHIDLIGATFSPRLAGNLNILAFIGAVFFILAAIVIFSSAICFVSHRKRRNRALENAKRRGKLKNVQFIFSLLRINISLLPLLPRRNALPQIFRWRWKRAWICSRWPAPKAAANIRGKLMITYA